MAGAVGCIDYVAVVNVICNTVSLVALAWIGVNVQRGDARDRR